MNPKPYFTFGYQSLKGICPAPPAKASKQGLGKGSLTSIIYVFASLQEIYTCARDAGAALDYPMNPLFTSYDIVAAHLERRQYFDKNSGE